MGRRPCYEKVGLNKGGWTAAEDEMLIAYIKANGEGKWRDLPKKAGLKRCGKSCRLRWFNYLNPEIRCGNITPEEEELIIDLHMYLGNRWSLIAKRIPGRTENEIKTYWNTILHKKFQDGQSSFAPPKRNPGKISHGQKSSSSVDSQAIDPPALVHPSDLGSGDNKSNEDMDKYTRFLLDEDDNDVPSDLAFSSEDSMFDYWIGDTCIEPNNLYDHHVVWNADIATRQ